VPIHRQAEVCAYEEVTVSNKEIVEDLDKKDAIEVVEGLLKRFPDLVDIILKYWKEEGKLYPKSIKETLIKKYQEENKSLENFIKTN
jgi:hypothetical protein